ncbi:MAG: hypothetical protein NZ742_06530 [Acidobacteria bacterium]|nr:hypothetical protein [Acidobacteriota bacterium]MDW7984529.1 hypothetical protein [Acidobacteriota bacterium]
MGQTGPPDEALPRVLADVYRRIADPQVRQFAIGRAVDPVTAFVQLRQAVQPPPSQFQILYEGGPTDQVRTVERALRRRLGKDPRYRPIPTLGRPSKRRAYQYVFIVLWD